MPTRIPPNQARIVFFFGAILFAPLAALAGSRIVAWGDLDQSDVPAAQTNVLAVAAGHYHNLSLSSAGTVSAWPVTMSDPGSQVPLSVRNAALVRIAAGVGHDLGIRSDGTVVAWGDNTYGQTSVPSNLRQVVAIAAGGYHSLALREDRSVVAWGANFYGQRAIPASATNVVAIAAGFYHSLALRADGTVVTWGDDSFGQTEVPGNLMKAVAIAAAGDHSLALTAEGKVLAWGDDSYGQSSPPLDLTNAVAIAAGDYHSLALRGDGTVVAWGPRLNGATSVPKELTNVLALAAGGMHSLALVSDDPAALTYPLTFRTEVCGATVRLDAGVPQAGTLSYQWSLNGVPLSEATNAQFVLVDAQTNQSGIYSLVVSNAFGLIDRAAIQLAVVPSFILSSPASQTNFAGNTMNLSVTASSTVLLAYQWRLDGTNLPGATSSTLSLPNITPDQAGRYSVLLSNAYGLVVGPDTYCEVLNLVQWTSSGIKGTNVGDVVGIAASDSGYGLGIRSDGTVVSWGKPPSPNAATPKDLTNIVEVAAGYEHGLALEGDGKVFAWGGYYGQANVPADLTNAVAVAAGEFHSLALRSDGTVAAWGEASAATRVPPGVSNIVGVAAGNEDSLAVTSDGQVIVWGTTPYGDFPIPADLTNAVAVAAGQSHFVALRDDGSVAAWGDDSSGQTDIPRGITNAIAVSASVDYSFALTEDGRLRAWGNRSELKTNILSALSNIVAIAAGQGGNGPNHYALIGSGPPRVTGHPVSRTVALGTRTSFQVTASGLPPLRYQWRCKGKDLPGATSAILTLTNVQIGQAGDYFVSVSNAVGGAQSESAFLDVAPLLLSGVTSQPYNHLGYVGGTAWFSAAAQGVGIQYQWLTNGIAIEGATNRTLSLTNLQLDQAAQYSVVVSNYSGQLKSADIPLQVHPLWLISQSQSQTNYLGAYGVLSVYVIGSPPLSYQWMHDGTAVPGATQPVLYFNNIQSSQSGDYYAVITNAYGATNSSTVSLTLVPIMIIDQPHNLTSTAGGPASFNISARGAGQLSYQWFFNGTAIEGATDSTLSFAATTPAEAGFYSVTVSNAFGVVTSQEASLVVLNVAQWQNNSTGAVNLLSIPANLVGIASSSAGWAIAAQEDGKVFALPAILSPPMIPEGLTGVVSVGAGWSHAVALRADGTVRAWGDNGFGQTNVPPGLSNVVAIAAGDLHNLALRADGTVVAWGDNRFGQTTVPTGLTNIVAITAGTNDSVALTRDGRVVVWGANTEGGRLTAPAELTNVAAVAAGAGLILALRSDGTIASWTTSSSSPTDFPDGTNQIVAISAGGGHDLELSVAGTLLSWASPTNLPNAISNITAIAAGPNDWALLGGEPPALQVPLNVLRYDTHGFAVSPLSRSGRVYALEFKDSLTDPEWTSLPLVAGNGTWLVLTDPSPAGAQRFYRVRQW